MSERTVFIPKGLPPDKAHQCARMVALALLRGNAEEAHAAIDVAMGDDAAMPDSLEERLQLPLTVIGLEVRTVNALERAGITTVGDVLKTHRIELLSLPNVAETTVTKIVEAVKRLGFGAEGGKHV